MLDFFHLVMQVQVGFKVRVVGSCDEKLVPRAQGPDNGQPSKARVEPW